MSVLDSIIEGDRLPWTQCPSFAIGRLYNVRNGILRHKQNVYENTKNHIDVGGLRLGLPPFPFWGDTTFCIGIGAGLLMVQSGVKKERKFSSEQTASCNPAPQDT